MIGIGKNLFKANVKAAGGPSFVGLLDTYPNASAAYSLRKLRSAYAGNCIRVRRSSDNTEQNIGFVNNALDTATLLTFCGAANGFVTTWYDQSGNANNLVMTTAVSQPQIVSSGSLLTLTGTGTAKVSMSFDGINDYFLLNSTISMSGTDVFSCFDVEKKNVSTFGGNVLSNNSGGSPITAWDYGGTFYLSATRSTPTNSYISKAYPGNSYNLISSFSLNSVANSNIYVNGTMLTGYSSGADNNSNQFIAFNKRSAIEFSNVRAQEFILYLNDKSANVSAIQNNINTYWQIY